MTRRIGEEVPVQARPLKHVTQRLGIELVETLPADPLRFDETRLQQNTQMLRHGGLRHVERSGDIVDRPFAGTQPVEDRSSRWIGDRSKDVDRRSHGGHSNKRLLMHQLRLSPVLLNGKRRRRIPEPAWENEPT